jgi:RNA exonuclease 4
VVNYLTWVSGITYQKIAHAPTYTQIFRRLCGLLEGAVLVGHTIENDMKVLPNLRNKTIDIKQFSRYKSEGGLPFSLKKLASRELGLSIQEGEHNSGEDARATMQLFAKFKQ